MDNINLKNKDVIMNTYAQLPNIFTYGEDVYLIDEEGNKYLDFVAGIAVNGLGYSNKKLKNALIEQVDKLTHVSNLYYTDIQLKAANKLVTKLGFDKAFFCNSGAEAVEAAMKLARKYAKYKGYEQAHEIITMKNSFHGRTLGAITATGQIKYQKGLDPLLPGVYYADYNDFESVKALVSDKTCAIMLEVIQGEGGIVMADKEFLVKVKELCVEKDILLIFDEVQTGIGRTGYPCGFMYYNIKPDIIALAKGLGAGVPVGAMLATGEAAKGFNPGDHASTYGGNPLVMAAVDVVVDEVMSQDMLSHIQEMGLYLKEQLTLLQEEFDCIKELKGTGLIQGIKLSYAPKELTTKAYDKKLLLVGAGADVVRFVPPFTVQKKHIDEMISILKEVL